MSQALGLINAALLAAVLFAGVSALMVALSMPLWRSRLQRLAPPAQARALYLLCIAPVALGLAMTALCFVPGALGTVWSSLDHCLDHGGHGHLCLIHGVGSAGTALGWSLVLVALGGFLVRLGRQQYRSRRLSRQLAQLADSARLHEPSGALLIDSPLPFAAVVGRRCQVLLSTPLLERLSPAHLEAVLEHERAHLRRRDPLFRALAAALSCAHLPGVRRRLLDHLELASERACDEEAGARVGSRVHVAQALLAVERLLQEYPRHRRDPDHRGPAGQVAFARSHLVQRVEALLAPGRDAATGGHHHWRSRSGLLALLSLAALGVAPLHHTAEIMIALIAH